MLRFDAVMQLELLVGNVVITSVAASVDTTVINILTTTR